jgi:hypothetical protein
MTDHNACAGADISKARCGTRTGSSRERIAAAIRRTAVAVTSTAVRPAAMTDHDARARADISEACCGACPGSRRERVVAIRRTAVAASAAACVATPVMAAVAVGSERYAHPCAHCRMMMCRLTKVGACSRSDDGRRMIGILTGTSVMGTAADGRPGACAHLCPNHICAHTGASGGSGGGPQRVQIVRAQAGDRASPGANATSRCSRTSADADAGTIVRARAAAKSGWAANARAQARAANARHTADTRAEPDCAADAGHTADPDAQSGAAAHNRGTDPGAHTRDQAAGPR